MAILKTHRLLRPAWRDSNTISFETTSGFTARVPYQSACQTGPPREPPLSTDHSPTVDRHLGDKNASF